jgi:hypothetical protein
MQDALINNPGQRHRQTHGLDFFSPFTVATLLFIMFMLMLLSGWHKELSFDEPHNLRYGTDFLTKGPLAETDGQRMPIFALHALTCKSYGCASDKITGHPWLQLGVRLPSILFTLALGLLVWYWCRSLYGSQAGMGALLLYVFNPTLLAHGKEITSDVITTFFVVLTVFFFWKWRTGKKTRFFYFTALAAGIAIVTKFSSILLLGILPLIAITQKLLTRNLRFGWNILWDVLKKSTVFLFLVWIIINSAYLFQGSFESSRSYAWQSRFYQKIAKIDFPMPFPRIFVRGLDYSHFIEENDQYGRGNNYILGHRHRKGRDYAFLVMILLKSPLALFVILLAALASKKSSKPQPGQDSPGPYLWVPFALWLLFFSSFCDLQVGIRYILPGYIFLIIFAGSAFQNIEGKIKAAVLGAACLWYVFSVLSYHPHYMPYFNELIGDRINAYKYLADSNLDWEDKTYYIKKWEAEHPKIRYLTHPEAMNHPTPGFFLMPANSYVGVFDQDQYAWIRDFKPLAHIAYSHYLLYITPDELALALKRRPILGVKK